MKSWKDVAHLFCNGKFKVKWSDIVWNLIGLEYDYGLLLQQETHGDTCQRFKNCTLIARKIEDMSDQEFKNIPSYTDQFSKSFTVNWMKKYWNEIMITDFIYLLSIGVYPFDQSHFQDGTVIDIKTL